MKSEVAEALEALEEEGGRLSATAVVEAARPLSSPLHSYFTWSDADAASAWRFRQAESLIRSYRIRVSEVAGAPAGDYQVRRYVSARHAGMSSAPAGTYLRAEALPPRAQELLLLRMDRELKSLHLRYGHLKEFWSAIEALKPVS